MNTTFGRVCAETSLDPIATAAMHKGASRRIRRGAKLGFTLFSSAGAFAGTCRRCAFGCLG